MGAPPPPDFPTPEEQGEASIDAEFKPSPAGASLCGFGFPLFFFSFTLPGFKFPPFDFPPRFSFSLTLNCDLSNPIDAEIAFGGGRVASQNPDQDEIDS